MKILNLIKNHPIWTIWIVTLILYITNAINTGEPNPAGYCIIGFFLMALLSPWIRSVRKKKERKEEIDYLAQKLKEK